MLSLSKHEHGISEPAAGLPAAPAAADSTAVVESWMAEALAPTPLPAGTSSRELVRRAIAFDRPARLPYGLLMPVRSDFFEIAALRRVVGAEPCAEGGEGYCDEWGVRRRATSYSWDPVVSHPLADLERLDSYRFPDAASLVNAESVAPFVRRARDAGKYVVAADPVSMYERLESLLGFESLLTAPRREAGAFAALLDHLADLTVEAIGMVSRLPGVDAFMTWQDLAAQTGPHVSLDTFRRFFKPSYARIAAAAHEKNLHFIWHICGAVADLIPELIDLGVDVLQLDQPRLVGHEVLATRFGGKVCFWNTIDTQWAVAGPRSPADLHAEASAMIRPFADLPGGLMLRHYPFPDDIRLTPEFHEDTARAFAEIAGLRAAV